MTAAATREGLAIALLLGDAKISGGTNVILEHALALRSAGHRVTLVTPHPVADDVLRWKPGASALARSTLRDCRGARFDLAPATWFGSAFPGIVASSQAPSAATLGPGIDRAAAATERAVGVHRSMDEFARQEWPAAALRRSHVPGLRLLYDLYRSTADRGGK